MNIQILQLVEGARRARGLTVIIDVFRAFSTESFIMARNPQKIIPVGDVKIAWEYKTKHPDAVLCGERGGTIIDGFDYGNSPSVVAGEDFTGKTVIHTTSAGTQGIVNAVRADEILGGCLVNADAVAHYIIKKQPANVSLVCMGLAGKQPTDEDTLCAEYIKGLLEGRPLTDISARIEKLRHTDGAKFFDEAQQHIFPRRDFELSTMVGICPFVLRLTRDAESGLHQMARIDVPESFIPPIDVRLDDFTAEQRLFLPDWFQATIDP